MIVVADAGPLHYLILLGRSDLLRTLFSEIVIPQAVRKELEHASAPVEVRDWIASPPQWARVVAASSTDASLPVGAGEREAIALALELKADLLVVDDKKARRVAQEHGITVAGTLGILRVAHDRGLVDLPSALGELVRRGFRVSDRLVGQILTGLPDRQPPQG